MKRRAIPDPRISAAAAKAQLVTMLYQCRPEALAGFTVDGLCATHRVDRKVAEYELQIARQKRGVAA